VSDQISTISTAGVLESALELLKRGRCVGAYARAINKSVVSEADPFAETFCPLGALNRAVVDQLQDGPPLFGSEELERARQLVERVIRRRWPVECGRADAEKRCDSTESLILTWADGWLTREPGGGIAPPSQDEVLLVLAEAIGLAELEEGGQC
jgi:hypothetical protein